MADQRDRTLSPGSSVLFADVRRLLDVPAQDGTTWHFARVAPAQAGGGRKFSDPEQLAEQIQRRLDALAARAEARGEQVRRERIVVAYDTYAYSPKTKQVVIKREWR